MRINIFAFLFREENSCYSSILGAECSTSERNSSTVRPGCAGYLSDPPGVMGVETTTLEFPIVQGYSSRLSFDVSGAVLVQNPRHTI